VLKVVPRLSSVQVILSLRPLRDGTKHPFMMAETSMSVVAGVLRYRLVQFNSNTPSYPTRCAQTPFMGPSKPGSRRCRHIGRQERISCTPGRFIVAVQIPITLQPLHDLLHLTIPIGPKDDQTADGTGKYQSDSETDPKTPQPHAVLESDVHADWDTNAIIGTNVGEVD